MQKRCHIILNPKSGSNVDLSCIRYLRDTLRKNGWDIRIELTQSLEHAGVLAKKAIQASCDAIIVAGGDGTVRTVVEAMAGSEIPLLIVPRGTENLLATELGLDGSHLLTREALEHGKIRDLDLGQANDKHFMAIVGVGFDAEVVRRVVQNRSGHITPAGYIWPICRTFWEHQFPRLRVIADGEIICDDHALVFVANIGRYAAGLKITPHADCGDGKLDVTIYKCKRRRELLLLSGLTILRRTERNPNVIRKRCRTVEITSPDPETAVQIDGDPGPSLPLRISVLHAAAKVLTPPPPEGMEWCPPVRFYHLKRWLLR